MSSFVANLDQHSFAFADDIEVLVGAEEKRFCVHRSIICPKSAFFEAACSQRWNQRASEALVPIKLPMEDPGIFDIYLYCVYTSKADVGSLDETLSDEEDMTNSEKAETRLARAFIMADRLQDIISANSFIKKIMTLCETRGAVPGQAMASLVGQHTFVGSPLHNLVVDLLVHVVRPQLISDICEDETVPKSFVAEILVKKTKLEQKRTEVDQDNVEIGEICRYYLHDSRHPSCGEYCLH